MTLHPSELHNSAVEQEAKAHLPRLGLRRFQGSPAIEAKDSGRRGLGEDRNLW